MAQPRWYATITYRYDDGPRNVSFYFPEMTDLDRIVEAGPHWDTIERIEVRRYNPPLPNLTIEQAEKM